MSNTALLTRPAPARHLHAVPPIVDEPAARTPRGFALYVGLDEAKAAFETFAGGESGKVILEYR